MVRLIAFDQESAAELRQQMPQHQVFEHGASDVVDFAVGGPETLVAVLPVDAPGEAAVAVFRQRALERTPERPPEPAITSIQRKSPNTSQTLSARSVEPGITEPARTRAGGFLGLRDEAVFEEGEERPAQKVGWWKRFWDEE